MSNLYDIYLEQAKQYHKDDNKWQGVDLKKLNAYSFTLYSDKSKLEEYDIFIICVPTPLLNGRPDVSMICQAGELISKIIKKGIQITCPFFCA